MKNQKKNKAEIKRQDFDRYTISGLWQTMCGYIVLLFVKEMITNRYLINFSIDLLVAVVAFYITLHNLYTQYKIIKSHRLTLKPFIVQLVGIIFGFFVVIMTVRSPFDISFLILVLAHLTSKRMFKKYLNI